MRFHGVRAFDSFPRAYWEPGRGVCTLLYPRHRLPPLRPFPLQRMGGWAQHAPDNGDGTLAINAGKKAGLTDKAVSEGASTR